ncbi:aminotransferase class I/II-fold pyridoxal phosphate-dependent enzyme [Georgenia sp. TF02-10]|uniref:MalY/PatB family protein n=1 Tax=Georgenia sp. TF02-10 TaxID=2917725 RepID=UPI001FA6EF84|nr:aminotransferase class I/II-fold pyridoxal phosphate-dependent enzyme [Georgenia sp. TF02-10]UNX53881.1 aminotransferase class I/II-fold pyridoxal phosphate-dependent enzyme [Georgenia sp. TF02-10]
MTAVDFDSITAEDLRRAGSMKWTTFPDCLGAFLAEMDFGVPPVVRDLVRRAADDGALGYLPGPERAALRQATAGWLGRTTGWHVPADRVHLVPDVLSVLRATIRHFTPPGSAVIVPTPAYMPFLTVPGAADREVVQVPCRPDAAGRYTLDLAGIDAAFAAGAGLLVLCNPWNPVGRVLTREELLAVVDVVHRHGGRVFADEIHAPLLLDDVRHVPYAAVDERAAAHTVTAVAASKGWNVPGLKCAQMILSNDADAAAFAPYSVDAGDTVGLLGARAATAVYTDDGGWLAEVLAYLRGNRDALAELVAEHLPGAVLSRIEGTYIAWLDCRGLGLPAPPAEFFRQAAGVALTDGAACGAAGEGFVRLVMATPRPLLRTMVTQMGAAVAEQRRDG